MELSTVGHLELGRRFPDRHTALNIELIMFVHLIFSAFLVKNLTTLLADMEPEDAIEYVLPIVKTFSADAMESVREALAMHLDRIVLYFFQVRRQRLIRTLLFISNISLKQQY